MRPTKMMFRPGDIPSNPYKLALNLAAIGAKVWCDGHIVEADCDGQVLLDAVDEFNKSNCGMKYIGLYSRGEIRRPSRIKGTEVSITCLT